MLQANFLKAAQLDDPIEREQAMTRLQVLQGKLNQGESLEVVEALAKALPLSGGDSPKVALERAKQEAIARERITST